VFVGLVGRYMDKDGKDGKGKLKMKIKIEN